MSVYPAIARNTYWSALSTFGGILLGLTANVVLARALGASKLGQFDYWMWLIGLLALVASPGLPQAVTKFASEYLGRNQTALASAIFGRLLLLELALAAAVGLIFVAFALTTRSDGAAIHVTLALAAALLAVEGYLIAAAKGAQDFRIFSQASLAGGALYAVAAILIAALGWGIHQLLLVFLARRITAIALTGRMLPRHYRLEGALQTGVPPELRRRIVRYCRDIVLIFATSTVPLERSGVFFLNRFATDADIAIYSQSLDLSMKAMAIPAVFTATLLPTFSTLHGQSRRADGDAAAHREGRRERLREAYLTSNRIAALVALPIGLGGAAISPLIGLLYGPDFLAMPPVAAIFFAGGILSAVAAVSVSILHSEERQQFVVRLNAIVAVMNLLLSLFLVPALGAVGAAIATSGSRAVSAALCMAYTARRLQVASPFRLLGRIALPASLAAAAAWIISVSVGSVVAAVVAAALAYPVMVRLFAALEASDRALLGQLGRNLPRAIAPAYAMLVNFLVRHERKP